MFGSSKDNTFNYINIMTNQWIKKCAFIGLFSIGTFAQAQDRNVLWYDKPAANWNEALPLGNGYIGTMVFGAAKQERLQLNEATIWGGGPNNTIDPEARPYVDQVRKLLDEKKYQQAQQLANQRLGPKGNSGMPYQLAGNLYFDFPGHDNVTAYRRDLNIQNATASVSYVLDGVTYKREYFTSFGSNVLMVRLTASKPGKITCRTSLQSPLGTGLTATNDRITLLGAGSNHENMKPAIKFEVQARVKVSGGSFKRDSTAIAITNADTAVVYLAIATNFVNYHDVSADPHQRTESVLAAATKKSYASLLKENIAFYKNYYQRVSLDLGTSDAAKLPTNERIQNFAKGGDPQLAELYFQFGRYLLICSSQPGSQAATLQGLWNGELKGPWDSKYTININTEMNYWPAESTQLSELNQPLFNLISDLSVTGKPQAQVMYGARGWVSHHNTDIWRITGIVDGAPWGLWPTSNAWLSQHLWEHYLYTGDKAFLKKYYPIMKGAAEYFVDALHTEPEHKWLVVSPSISPEHDYRAGGSTQAVTAGATMDNQLVFGLFTAVDRAGAILGTDKAFRDTLLRMRDRLPPMQVGQYGQLQEWLDDWDSPTDNHRHVSHLYGLFPGNQISPFTQPKLFAGVKNSLLYRGDVSTGWSMAWKINLWARLFDGNHAYKLITDQIAPVGRGSGGTYPNLFDAHPPFQIDGNFGCTSGIAEMLVQSHDGDIYLLPALPDAWSSGKVNGLAARGGFTIDMEWKDKKVTKLVVHSAIGGNFRVRIGQQVANASLKKAAGQNANPLYATMTVKEPIIKQGSKDLSITLPTTWVYDLTTVKGKSYTVIN